MYKHRWLQALFDSGAAHEAPLPPPLATLTTFQKLLVLRCLRPDKVVAGIQNFVAEHLGQRFIEAQPLDLGACYRESEPATPLIFVLSAGANHLQ